MKYVSLTIRCLTALTMGIMLGRAGQANVKHPAWCALPPEPAALAQLALNPDCEDDGWRIGPDLELVHDDVLDREVLEHTGGRRGWIRSSAPLPEGFELTALVRIMEDGHGVVLGAGASGADSNPDTDWAISLTPRAGGAQLRAQTITSGRDHYLEDTTRLAGGPSRSMPPALDSIPNRIDFGMRFTTAPSPLAEEEYRRDIESALSVQESRGKKTERWHQVRIERLPGRLRMFVNGVPVGESRAAGRISGDAHLRLDRSVRVADLEIRPLEQDIAPYYPVDITKRLNARAMGGNGAAALAEGYLPEPGRGEVADISFLFSRDHIGNDHIDIGHSLFRERNRIGHQGSVTRLIWPDPRTQFDPGRITFTVPNRAYNRIWLIAAFDEEPHTVPVITARFYQGGPAWRGGGFPVDSAVEVPGLTAQSAPGTARRLPVKGADGSDISLWLVPIELDAARLASEMRTIGQIGRSVVLDRLYLELTKEVHPFRAYPDPHNYGRFQGGLPSGVRVFAMTLEEAPVHMVAGGNRHGNVYVEPEQPLWQVDLNNQRAEPVSGRVRLTITDPYGEPAGAEEKAFSLTPGGAARLEIPLKPELYGLHTVLTEVKIEAPEESAGGGILRRLSRRAMHQSVSLARKGAFVQLPPDTREATRDTSPWTLGMGDGSHGRHDVFEDNAYLLRAAGARRRRGDVEKLNTWGFDSHGRNIGHRIRREDGSGWPQRGAQPWAFEDPYDPEKYAENRDVVGKNVAEWHETNPLTRSYSMFVETSITRELTHGTPRRYIGEDPTWTEEEERRVRGHMIYGKAVCEGIRKHAPDAPIALGWANSAFTIPLLESGFPRELFDYIGLDDPVFERTPEMPIREVAANRDWLLRQAMKEHGYEDVPVIHVESYFPCSNPFALGWRRSADHYVRLMLGSRARTPAVFYSNVLGLQDCSSAWGSQHYGEHGAITRQPEANPKPAYAAFATMTRLLDPGEYQGWLDTGSHSAYCLHFISNRRNVYPMWTLRGKRRAHLQLPEGAEAVMVDESGNEFPLQPESGVVSVSLTPTPLWITSDEPVESVRLGETDHTFVRREHPLMYAQFGDGTADIYRPENQVCPGDHYVLLDALDKPWNYIPGPYPAHAEGHWAMPRHDGPMRSEQAHSDRFDAPVWEIELLNPDIQRELTAWYGVFEPTKPLDIPGKARALGVWAKGFSNWGRIVYEIEDAGGEVWRSIGRKNSWNCDDIHTWSYFNFDGWRYIEFPLPSHLPYDNYREHDTTWWGSDGGNKVVELPVKLRRIIIELRTHNVYIDELVEVEDRSVRLNHLKAIYDDAEAMTEAPVKLQRETAGLLREKRDMDVSALPNPIAGLIETGVGKPTAFVKLAPPDDYDGLVTRLEIEIRPVKNARKYRIYVSAYEDGRGAEQIAEGEKPMLEATRLQPGVELYLFATYMDADGNESKPSEARRILLIDDFPFR